MTNEFYISDKALAAINAVEGLSLNAKNKAYLEGLRAQNLSPDQQRKAIREAYEEAV